jgi:hypothetical protein
MVQEGGALSFALHIFALAYYKLPKTLKVHINHAASGHFYRLSPHSFNITPCLTCCKRAFPSFVVQALFRKQIVEQHSSFIHSLLEIAHISRAHTFRY